MSKKNKTKRKKRIFNKYHSINRIKRKKSRRQYSYKPLKRKSKDRNIKNNLNTVSLIVEEKVIETNIQSQKSKGDEKREKIFEIFKNHLNFLNDKGFVSTDKDIYLCPLDLKPHHNVYEDDPLTLEDAPPKSLGGKAHVLTCKSCNNKRGQDIDAELAKFLKEAKNINVAFNRLKAGKSINNLHLPKSDHEVVLEINGKYIDGKMGFEKEGKMSVVLPIELAPDTVLNFVGSKVPKWAQYSLLKAAYMLLFKKTGYTLLLEKCCDVVRKQIEKPDENIYP
ncbi:MAG: HNH endonuclease, partial [Tannerellaceae bacterium]|nr:HNH endonuclease [Tannerellaceae bacterium]